MHHYQAKHGVECLKREEYKFHQPASPSVAKPSEAGLGGGSGQRLSQAAAEQGVNATTSGELPPQPLNTRMRKAVHSQPRRSTTLTSHGTHPRKRTSPPIGAVNHIVLSGVVSVFRKVTYLKTVCCNSNWQLTLTIPALGIPTKTSTRFVCTTCPHCRIRSMVQEGQSVLVSGRLRLVPQFESSTNKLPFPVVMVHPGLESWRRPKRVRVARGNEWRVQLLVSFKIRLQRARETKKVNIPSCFKIETLFATLRCCLSSYFSFTKKKLNKMSALNRSALSTVEPP